MTAVCTAAFAPSVIGDLGALGLLDFLRHSFREGPHVLSGDLAGLRMTVEALQHCRTEEVANIRLALTANSSRKEKARIRETSSP